MTMRQKGSILNRRDRVMEALTRQGQPGSQSGQQVGPVHPEDGMFSVPYQGGNALSGYQGTQSGPADYNYPEPFSELLETYNRYRNGIPSPDSPDWVFEELRRKRGY